MKINLTSSNPALDSIFENPDQVITLDANILIPPSRTRLTRIGFSFPKFKAAWLDPVFRAFPNLAIHEAVYDELLLPSVKSYVDSMATSIPSHLTIHKDSDLTDVEKTLRDSIVEKISPFTRYEPSLDNKDDRGEVKSLAYIAVKELLYFAAHDSNAIQLVEKAEEWETGLDNVQAIRMYELIFYLDRTGAGDRQALKMLYNPFSGLRRS